MKKIGILGGTFNPIHNGHLIMAENARTFCSLDKVLLIPSGNSYMKDPQDILPGSVRLKMAGLAAMENPFFEVSTIEVEREGNSYTWETLSGLHALYPDAVLYNIVGADTLLSMESWKHPERIFSSCVTLAAVREGWQDQALTEQIEHIARKYHADVRILPSLHIEISATQIRKRCSLGQSIRYLVPEQVRTFLEENGYYGSHVQEES